MRKVVFFISVLFYLSVLSGAPSLYVFNFTSTQANNSLPVQATEILIRQLVKENYYQVLNNDNVFKSRDLGGVLSSDYTDAGKALDAVRLMAVDYIVFGKVVMRDQDIKISVTMFETELGRVMKNRTIYCDTFEDIETGLAVVANQLFYTKRVGLTVSDFLIENDKYLELNRSARIYNASGAALTAGGIFAFIAGTFVPLPSGARAFYIGASGCFTGSLICLINGSQRKKEARKVLMKITPYEAGREISLLFTKNF